MSAPSAFPTYCPAIARLVSVSLTLLLALALTSSVCGAPKEEYEFFETKIRPVLVQHCYACHNSFGKAKGGLALDYQGALLAGGDSGEVVIAGKPEESILLHALRHENGYEMPANAPPLAADVIADFAHWIKVGLPDPRVEKPQAPNSEAAPEWAEIRDDRKQWWAFQPLQAAAIPEVDKVDWANSPIDRFLYDRMRREGLTPQEVAAPETLVRRVHLILTGQLPSPEVAREFLKAPTDAAYEALVDKLLASQEFGECWARHWEDWYRYAESHGSEGDPRIPYAQQYRDYLIRALNNDIGYDQLLREHVAGDLLESPRINAALSLNESAVGAAHFRMVPHGYGVTDAYGEQVTFTDNQIDVVSKAMLGITISCARCHNHKFDPISQKDFYRFYGIFASARPASIVIDSPDKLSRNKAEILQLKDKLRDQLATHWLTQLPDLRAWLARYRAEDKQPPHYADPMGIWLLLKDESPEAIPAKLQVFAANLAQVRKSRAESIANASAYLDLKDPANQSRWKALGNSSAPSISPAGSFAIQPEGSEALLAIYPGGVYSHLISNKHAAVFNSENFPIHGKHAYVRAAGSGAQARTPIRSYPLSRGASLHPSNTLNKPALDWVQLNAKWEYWRGEQCHFELSTGKDMLPYPSGADRSWFGVTEIYAGDTPPVSEGASLLALVPQHAQLPTVDAIAAAYETTLRDAVTAWRRGACSDVQAEFLNEFIQLGFFDNQLKSLPQPIQDQIAAYRKLEQAIPVPTRAPGVIEVQPLDQPLLVRGDHRTEAAAVPQGFLEVFEGRTYDHQTSGRLQLASDIVSDQNTLKSRVLVNRLWAYVFGSGLVASTDNFGRLGSEPTHPELLDYLALRFEQNEWSLKRTIRDLVTSRAFRSSGQADDRTHEQDPSNRLLSYFSPRRLDAETIYDTVGQMSKQPTRAIYLPVIRNEQNPFLAAFNAPLPTTTISARTNTNVPAQALAMMNGEVTIDAARQWAERIDQQAADLSAEEKIRKMFFEAFVRSPSATEIELLMAHYHGTEFADSQIRELTTQLQSLQQQIDKSREKKNQLVTLVRKQSNSTVSVQPERQGPLPISEWTFERDAKDQLGSLDGQLQGAAKIEQGALTLNGGYLVTKPLNKPLKAKTLEVSVSLDDGKQAGGGVMSVQTRDGQIFDAIVFGERRPGYWLAGSDFHLRTAPLNGTPEEVRDQPILLAIVYDEDGTITFYRNGQLYGEPYRKGALVSFEPDAAEIVFGLRHGVQATPGRMFLGRIHEARLYDRALSAAEIAASKQRWSSAESLAGGTPEQKQKYALLQSELQTLTLAKEQGAAELMKWRQQLRSHGTYGIAYAILNSKEFLYVY